MAIEAPRSPPAFLCVWSKSKKSKRTPLGATTMMFPIVWFWVPGSKLMRAGSHVFPPSVVRENQLGPWNAWAWMLEPEPRQRCTGSRRQSI